MNDKITRQVERIAIGREYVERKLTLGPGTHECTYGKDGQCLYCPKWATLKAGARTGELSWD